MSDRKSMAEILAAVMSGAGGEAPTFAIMNHRDWWTLRRGPKWRYPLPVPRTLARSRRPPFRSLRAMLRDTRTAGWER